jgi:hypothetical protein
MRGQRARQSSGVYALGCTPGTRNFDALGTTTFGWHSQPQHLLEESLEHATDFIQFASSQLTDSPWAWAFDVTGNLLSLTPVRTIGQGGQSVILTSATGTSAAFSLLAMTASRLSTASVQHRRR